MEVFDVSEEQQNAQVTVVAEQAGERVRRDGKRSWEESRFAPSEVQTL